MESTNQVVIWPDCPRKDGPGKGRKRRSNCGTKAGYYARCPLEKCYVLGRMDHNEAERQRSADNLARRTALGLAPAPKTGKKTSTVAKLSPDDHSARWEKHGEVWRPLGWGPLTSESAE